MEGKQQAGISGQQCDNYGNHGHGPYLPGPETGGSRRHHHQAYCHQGTQGPEPRHQIEDHQDEEGKVHGRTPPRYGPQVAGIEAFDDEGPVDNRQDRKRHRGDGGDQNQGGIIHRQNSAKEHMDKIDATAAQGDDENAHGQRNEIQGRKAGILP